MSGTNGTNDIRRMEGHRPVPKGFLAFFLALLAWGAWYGWTYTPETSGWSAYKEFAAAVTPAPAPAGGTPAPAGGPGGAPSAGKEAAAEEGEKIYERECAGCHGKDLKDPSGGPDLRGKLSFGSDDASLFESVAKGRPGGMPDFAASLGPDRIRKVVSYVGRERGGK